MPRLNSLGVAVMGIGGGGITSVNGTVPTALVGVTSGDWDFLTNTTIAGKADTGGGYELYSLLLPGGSLVQIGDGESTYFWSGGNVWTAYAAAFPGVRSNVSPLNLPLAGVGDVSADGWSALVDNFAIDTNISVYDETGDLQTQVSVTVFPENGTIRLRGNVLSYADAERVWSLRNRATGAVLPFAQRVSTQTALVPVTVGSLVYVLERDAVEPGEMLTIRQATMAQGYVITNDGIGYNPDVVHLSGTTVRVAYSTGQGELPDELVLWDINLANGAATKATIVGGAPVFVSQPNLSVVPLPASAVPGTGTPQVAALYQQPFINPGNKNRIDDKWYRALVNDLRGIGTVNLTNGTGTVDPAHGGTGTTTGLTVISPTAVKFSAESRLLGRGAGNGGGDGQEISPGTGLEMVGTTLQATGDGTGYWSLVTTGDTVTPEIVFDSNGDVISVFVPGP